MKIAFSFCIYGDSPKYCQGLVENLEIINEHYPSYYIYIYIYENVPQEYIEKYKTFKNTILKTSARSHNMFERFFLLEDEPDIDIMIVRDTDSRVHKRDRYCIDHFISSRFLCHTIRDHGYHHAHIMGGLWGLKRNNIIKVDKLYWEYEKTQNVLDCAKYRYDMNFLASQVYPKLVHSFVVYTFHPDLRMSDTETLSIIPFEVKERDFCGQVIYYDKYNSPIKEFNHPF
jgi:protein O-GlcNAc transferase